MLQIETGAAQTYMISPASQNVITSPTRMRVEDYLYQQKVAQQQTQNENVLINNLVEQ